MSTRLGVFAVAIVAGTVALRAQQIGVPAQAPPLAQGLEAWAEVFFSDAHSVTQGAPMYGGRRSTLLAAPLPTIELGTGESFCIFGKGDQRRHGWQVHVARIGGGAGVLAVDLEVTRVKSENAQPSVFRLSLKPGASVPLDYLTPDPGPSADQCGAIGMLLRVGLK
jgi:hypothetical protein